ncbi:MAG: sporulation initiation factor Spo0A C-terminal domain-containing protein [Clostridia bacterium]|nr:sporulation initiation factor Spo0A C-terminal domain-containing protein [Clostridia bacterium]
MYKPVNLRRLPQIIHECHRNRALSRLGKATDAQSDFERDAAYLRHRLAKLGILSRLSGSAYLAEAVLCIQQDSMLYRNLTRGLYAIIAERNGTTVSRVERAMRNAISVAYDRGGLSGAFTERPTNKQFIAYLLQALEERSSEFDDL